MSEFGTLTSWREEALGSLVEVLDSHRIPVSAKEREKRSGSVPYYGANGQQGFIDGQLFDEPLILLAEDGGNFDDYASRAIAYRISGPSWVNNHAHVIRAAENVSQDFIFFALEHRDIRRYISNGTRTKLTQSELRSIRITVPLLAAQRRIAEILNAADEAIRSTERVVAKLEHAKQGLLDTLLYPKQDGVTTIPKSWTRSTLGEYMHLVSGQHIPARLCNRSGGGVAYYTGPADFSGDLALVSQFTAYPQVMCKAGDILVTVKGSGCGRVAFASQDACISRQLMAVRPLGANEDFAFWFELIKSRYVELNSNASSGLIPGLSRAQLTGLPIIVPTERERLRISIMLTCAADRILREKELSAKLRLMKQGLMDGLLTGRVRVGASG